MNVNTDFSDTQANNAIVPSFPVGVIRQQLADIGEHALAAMALCEISHDEIDALREKGIASSIRLDVLTKATHRSVVLIQESTIVISLALEEIEGGAA